MAGTGTASARPPVPPTPAASGSPLAATMNLVDNTDRLSYVDTPKNVPELWFNETTDAWTTDDINHFAAPIAPKAVPEVCASLPGRHIRQSRPQGLHTPRPASISIRHATPDLERNNHEAALPDCALRVFRSFAPSLRASLLAGRPVRDQRHRHRHQRHSLPPWRQSAR